MKKCGIIFLSGLLALCLLTGCGSQSRKPAGSGTEPAGTSALTKTAQMKTSGETVNNEDAAKPASSDLKGSDKRGTKVTEAGSDTKTPASDNAQGTNVQNNNSGTAGGCCVTDQNRDNTAVPSARSELDFDKDGTISSADYELSGMSRDDFASKLVSDGDVGTSAEAEQVIDGEITVMCGVYSGACS